MKNSFSTLVGGDVVVQSKNEWFGLFRFLFIAFVIMYLIRSFLFSPIIVDGDSMLPTLHDKDQIIVNKYTYYVQEPKRFDVIIFHATEKRDFIKRVIGLPGEHVKIENETLYINGIEVEEKFLEESKEVLGSNEILTKDFILEDLPGEYEEIPDGFVFVLGDNRRNSTDSRDLGLIPIDQIVGKATTIYYPFNRMQIIKE